jgi:hypothetical protein
MSRAAVTPRAAGLAAVLSLLAAGAPGRADERTPALVRSIAPPHVVRPDRPGILPVFSDRRIARLLERFVGRPCDREAAEAWLLRRYRFLGYAATIEATCDDGALAIFVRESGYEIDLIAFDPGELARLDLKPSPDFEEEKRRLYPVPPGARSLLRGLLESHEGDLYNAERYRRDREALQPLGYTIAFVPGASGGDRAYPPGAYLVESLTPPPEERPYVKRATNYLGGTGSYAPRSGSALGLLYEKNEVFGRHDRLNISPTYNDALGGTLSYRAPLLAAPTQPRRLYDLGVDLYSEFRHNRELAGTLTDERRTGGGGSVGIRPLGLASGRDLRFQVGVRHERVDLSASIPGSPEESLTVLSLGATYDIRHMDRWPSFGARLAPTLDLSLDRAGGQRAFVRPGLDATFHGRLMAGFESEFHALGGTIDRAVPDYELWSLGGPVTVRGYQPDSFLGRHLAVLQSEFWFPLFRGTRDTVGDGATPSGASHLAPRAARFLKGALFVDGGTISGTPGGETVSIVGAGLGLRFVVPHQPLVVRLDLGRGLGSRGGHTYPYLSIGYHF